MHNSMSIYITKQQKEEWEDSIKEFYIIAYESNDEKWKGKALMLEELLSHAVVVVPVEKSWDKTVPDGIEEDTIFDYIKNKYPKGVIIKK